jgi:hypothetical protein
LLLVVIVNRSPLVRSCLSFSYSAIPSWSGNVKFAVIDGAVAVAIVATIVIGKGHPSLLGGELPRVMFLHFSRNFFTNI